MNIRYIILLMNDEVSMLSCQNLAFIHKDYVKSRILPRILVCYLEDYPCLHLAGDLFQLKPVQGFHIFDTRKPESYLWQKFQVAFLITNHRQADDKT